MYVSQLTACYNKQSQYDVRQHRTPGFTSWPTSASCVSVQLYVKLDGVGGVQCLDVSLHHACMRRTAV